MKNFRHADWLRARQLIPNSRAESLPFAQKTRKFRMECKWKDEFCLPKRKFSRENGFLER